MNSIKIILVYFLFTNLIPAQECESELIINCDLDSVNIFINDSLVSTNGEFIGKLQQGQYVITADERSDRWNSLTFIDTVVINDCNVRKLLIYFSNPSKKQFNQIYQKNNLIIKKYFLSDSAYNQVDLTLPTIEKKEMFINSTLFKALATSTVILGGISAYFKIKADRNFEDYLRTKDKSKLNLTKKYDLISGITFVTFQINFGYIIFRLLME